MTPEKFYELKHGNEPFLSQSSIIQLMKDFQSALAKEIPIEMCIEEKRTPISKLAS